MHYVGRYNVYIGILAELGSFCRVMYPYFILLGYNILLWIHRYALYTTYPLHSSTYMTQMEDEEAMTVRM